MGIGHEAAAFAGVEVDRAQRVEQTHQRGACVARATTADDERTACRGEQIRGLRDAFRIGQRTHTRFRREVLVLHKRRGNVRPQRIGREIEIRWPGLVAVTQRTREGFVQLLQDERRFPDGAGVARDRANQIGVDDVLQRATVFLRARRQSRKHEHARARDVRICDAGHRIRHARPGRDQGNADVAAQCTVGVGHVHGGAFVAHVDDRDALRIESHPDRHDVAAAQPEHAIDAAPLEEAGDDARDRVGGGSLLKGWCHSEVRGIS